jgi:hypothetical protein
VQRGIGQGYDQKGVCISETYVQRSIFISKARIRNNSALKAAVRIEILRSGEVSFIRDIRMICLSCIHRANHSYQ